MKEIKPKRNRQQEIIKLVIEINKIETKNFKEPMKCRVVERNLGRDGKN